MKRSHIYLIMLVVLIIYQPLFLSETIHQDIHLPESFSWTNIDGIDYTTPVKDQSPAPTCEAYALCAAMETLMQYQTGTLYQPDLSEAHLYFYAGGTYERGGVNVHDAANYLITHGVPDEGCFPDPHRPYDYPFQSIPGWENRTMKITEWGWVPHDQESIKQALIDYGPLTICIFVYDDMYQYKGGVYRISPESKRVGGHLVALVGYDDNTQSWLVKNSWGASWGDNGWFHMGYDESMFIDGCYGGETGIIYIDGIYGVMQPETPKITIEHPQIKTTYVFNIGIPSIIRNLEDVQEAAPRIIGPITIRLTAEQTNSVEFYLDDTLMETDTTPPFSWRCKANKGLHTIEIIAYNEQGISKDIIDVYFLI